MLEEDKRLQLDGIVSKMEQNKESEEDIRFVVDDFKKKYNQEKGIIGKTLDFGKTLAGALVDAEVKAGRLIGNSIALQTERKSIDESKERYMKTGNDFMKLAQNTADEAKKQRYFNLAQSNFNQAGKVLEDVVGKDYLETTNAQVLGTFGTVALDALTAGTYGAAAKTAKTGQLLKGATKVPTAVSKSVSETAKALGGKMAVYGGVGYLYDVGYNAMEGKEGINTLTPGFGTLLGTGIPVLGFGVGKAIKAMKGQPLEEVVKKGFEKGVRPSVSGKGSSSATEKYYAKAGAAVEMIVNNKKNLKFSREEAEVVGKLPETLEEFSQSISQTKSVIYDEYDALARKTGEQGALVDLTNIVEELNKSAADEILNIKDPRVASYAVDMAERLDKLNVSGLATPKNVQRLIEKFNEDLQTFYRNPSYGSVSRVGVDSMIANNLRKSLDEVIELATGAHYSQLKNAYGALKTIEKEVTHRALVDARKNNKSLLDFTDILTYGDLATGILTGNVSQVAAGVAGRGIKEWYKVLNDPNTIIKKMFERSQKAIDNKNFISNKIKENVNEADSFINKMFPQEGDESPKAVWEKIKSIRPGMNIQDINQMSEKERNALLKEAEKFKKKDYIYHETGKENIESIKKNGLKPTNGMYGKGVYFTDKIGTGEASGRGTLYRIDKNEFKDSLDGFPGDEFVPDVVKPESLEVSYDFGKTWEKVSQEKKASNLTSENALVAEAKKYSTLEEFLKAQGVRIRDPEMKFRNSFNEKLSDRISSGLKSSKIERNGNLVKVYRGQFSGKPREIMPGDYVGFSRKTAEGYSRGNPGSIKEIWVPSEDILLKKGAVANEGIYAPNGNNSLSSIYKQANEAQKAAIPPYKESGALTTKVLSKLEGRSEVSKQFISDMTNSGDLKQQERDLIRDILSRQKEEKVNVTKFAEDVKKELLPLNRKTIGAEYDALGNKSEPRYEGVSLDDDVRGNVANYSENIYESPVKTSAGSTHFGIESDRYFGHTRVEDIAPTIEELRAMGEKASVKNGTTRRVIEVQSDLYQKGNLERERIGNEIESISEFPMSKLEKNERILRNKELDKLQQYNNPTAHFRMVREEIKKAAEDGKTKLQFPTGETAMKIEGLGVGEGGTGWSKIKENGDWDWLNPDEKLTIGMEIERGAASGDEWIITDVLGDGKFKAVPKEQLDNYESLDSFMRNSPSGIVEEMKRTKETFDISGNVDKNNPIYKFYEKELSRYLKSNFNAQQVVDDKGVSWMEVNLEGKDYAKKPIQAFGFALPLFSFGEIKEKYEEVKDKFFGTKKFTVTRSTPEVKAAEIVKEEVNVPLEKQKREKDVATMWKSGNTYVVEKQYDKPQDLKKETTFDATAYDPKDKLQNDEDEKGAWGFPPVPGKHIAISDREVPLGAKVYVKELDKTFINADRMNGGWGEIPGYYRVDFAAQPGSDFEKKILNNPNLTLKIVGKATKAEALKN